MKQSNVKNKIHKNEKLWVIPLAAASVIAGATVTGSLNTTTVNAETTDTTTSSASSTPSAKTLTSIPTPANFYITINEKYVPVASRILIPLRLELMTSLILIKMTKVILPKHLSL